MRAHPLDLLKIPRRKNLFLRVTKPRIYVGGLQMWCILQVWFQNKRSKERRMKQMNGRGKFFMSSGRKMRGFPFGPPGMDDGRFAFYGGPPEAFYGGPNGGPPFPGEFYPPPPPFGAGWLTRNLPCRLITSSACMQRCSCFPFGYRGSVC